MSTPTIEPSAAGTRPRRVTSKTWHPCDFGRWCRSSFEEQTVLSRRLYGFATGTVPISAAPSLFLLPAVTERDSFVPAVTALPALVAGAACFFFGFTEA